MSLLALTDPQLWLGVRGALLVVHRGEAEVHQVPAHEVDEVQLHGDAHMTVAARNLLLRRGVEVAYLTADGRYRGRLTSGPGAWSERRLAQYRLALDPQRTVALARVLVQAKILAQRKVLADRQRHLRDPGVAGAATALRALVRRADVADSLDALRGVEGLAAARYFDVFPALLRHPDFTWTGRTRRPPTDPVNAALSFGYTLLVERVEAAVLRAGLDPYLGTLHGNARGAAALALDLAEPWRPAIDRLVLTLINRRALGPPDFEQPPVALDDDGPGEGAVYLARTGRKVFLSAWLDVRRAPVAGASTLDLALDRAVHAWRRAVEDGDDLILPTEDP